MPANGHRHTGHRAPAVTLLDDVDEAPARLWTAADPPTYATREWLAASRWPGDGVRYLTTGELLIPVRIVTEPGAWSRMNLIDICAGTPFGTPVAPELVAAARASAVPHLLVAAPGYHTVPIGSPDADPSSLVAAVEELAARSAMPAGFAYLPPRPGRMLAILRARGYTTGIVSVTTVLDLTGRSFADYLSTLDARRRTEVRRETRRFTDAGGMIAHFAGTGLADQLSTVAELECDLQRAHGFVADPRTYRTLNGGFLDRFGPRMHLLRADLDGEPVATVTLLHGGGDLVVRAYGARDRSDVRSAMVYFNLAYYAPIELGYRLGVRRIWFGPSTLDVKRRRGLTLVPLSAAVDRRVAHLPAMLAATDAHLRHLLAGWARR